MNVSGIELSIHMTIQLSVKCFYCKPYRIQLFRERLSEKMCTRQSRKVMWDMINSLFLTTVAVEPTFAAFLLHSQTNFHGLSCQFCQIPSEKKRTQNHPQCLSGLSRAVFLTTFLEIAVFSSSQCPLLPTSQHFHQDEGRNKDRAKRAKKSYALRNLNFNEESPQMGRPRMDGYFVFY